METLNIYRFWELPDKVQKNIIKKYSREFMQISLEYLKTTYTFAILELMQELKLARCIETHIVFDFGFSCNAVSGMVRKSGTSVDEFKQIATRIIEEADVTRFRYNVTSTLAKVLNEIDKQEITDIKDVVDMLANGFSETANDWLTDMRDPKFMQKYLAGRARCFMAYATEYGKFTEEGQMVVIK